MIFPGQAESLPIKLKKRHHRFHRLSACSIRQPGAEIVQHLAPERLIRTVRIYRLRANYLAFMKSCLPVADNKGRRAAAADCKRSVIIHDGSQTPVFRNQGRGAAMSYK